MNRKTLTIDNVPAWGVLALIDLVHRYAAKGRVRITDAQARIEVTIEGDPLEIESVRANLEEAGAGSRLRNA